MSRRARPSGLALGALALSVFFGAEAVDGPRSRADTLVALESAAGRQRLEQVERIVLAVDGDDDDENGHADHTQPPDVPADDLVSIVIPARGRVRLSVDGPLRLVEERPRSGRQRIWLQATGTGDAALVVDGAGSTRRIPVTPVSIRFLSGPDNRALGPTDAVAVSHHITNDAMLPRQFDWSGGTEDPDAIRLEVHDPSATAATIQASLTSRDATGNVRDRRSLVLRRDGAVGAHRSEWLRLVSDEMDAQAPGVAHRTLRVALRDHVDVEYSTPDGTVAQGARVGLPGSANDPRASLRATVRVRILRTSVGGIPAVGGTDERALEVAREQLTIANEIWLQCFVGFGDPTNADIAIVDPPPPSLLAISDGDGLPARGGGDIRFVANGQSIGPIPTRPGASPLDTALDVADAIRAAGFQARVTENPAAEFAAGRSADILVTTDRGALVVLAPPHAREVSTDLRQAVVIGSVELSDGLLEFDNMNAAAGTLEERTLIKALADNDPSTVDLFVVNRFTAGTRQGEAFIEADGGPIVNVVLLDRNGIRQQRDAWTVAHEVGHVLLDQPFHPDNVGEDRPWLLMDADSSAGLVTGPKRITEQECARARSLSGPRAVPTLLRPAD